MASPSPTTFVDWSSIGQFNPKQITRFRHRLGEEQMLELESLRKLAKRVEPRGLVKFKPGPGGDIRDRFLVTESHSKGYTMDDVFDRLSDPGMWLAIYHMTEDEQYRPFCARLEQELASHVEPTDPEFTALIWPFSCPRPPRSRRTTSISTRTSSSRCGARSA